MLLSVERPNRGSLCLLMTKGHVAALHGLVQAILPASVWNMCKRIIEVSQELGRSCRLLGNSRREYRDTNSRPQRCTRPMRSELTGATEVPPNEGNEVWWDGRQEVVAF